MFEVEGKEGKAEEEPSASAGKPTIHPSRLQQQGEGGEAAGTEEDSEKRKRFQVVCKHWRAGQCGLGDEDCPYLHSVRLSFPSSWTSHFVDTSFLLFCSSQPAAPTPHPQLLGHRSASAPLPLPLLAIPSPAPPTSLRSAIGDTSSLTCFRLWISSAATSG